MDTNDYYKVGIAFIVLILIIVATWYFTKSTTESAFYNGSQERSDQEAGTRYIYNTIQENALCDENPNYCAEHIPAPINDAAQDTQTRGLVPSANQPDHGLNMWKSEASTFAGIPDDTDGDGAISYFESKGKLVNQSVKDVSDMHLSSRFASESSQK
jgi:hypothetical protein